MKPLGVVLLLAISLTGCSRFTSSGRMDRAYYKQLKQVEKQRAKHRKELIAHERAQIPTLRKTPPPLEVQTVTSTSESQ